MAFMCDACRKQMTIQSTRTRQHGTVRRYACPCGHRLTTLESAMVSNGPGRRATRPGPNLPELAIADLTKAISQAESALKLLKEIKQ